MSRYLASRQSPAPLHGNLLGGLARLPPEVFTRGGAGSKRGGNAWGIAEGESKSRGGRSGSGRRGSLFLFFLFRIFGREKKQQETTRDWGRYPADRPRRTGDGTTNKDTTITTRDDDKKPKGTDNTKWTIQLRVSPTAAVQFISVVRFFFSMTTIRPDQPSKWADRTPATN